MTNTDPHAPVNLRTEYTTQPLGLDAPHPRFSWQLHDARRGARQTAYHLRVGTTPGASDLWDTGKVPSPQSIQLPYAGKPLASGQRAYWQVRIWDHLEQPSPFSDVASFEMALLSPDDWRTAQWISLPQRVDPKACYPAIYFRRGFSLPANVTRAHLYITARGIYDAHLNGQRVSSDYFRPGWTDYNKRIQYQTYDVTSMLARGDNALAVTVAEGWYSGHIAWREERGFYGQHPALLAQLVLELDNGKTEIIVTDAHWHATADGPLSQASFLHGETFDARKHDPAWAAAGFNDAAWSPVHAAPRDAVPLVAQAGPPVRRHEEITPIDRWQTADGKWILDLGQNMVGVARLTLRHVPAGAAVTLRFAEMLNPDRTLYTANLRKARCTDRYIAAGGHEETYEPRFTYHGFRYVEVSADNGATNTLDFSIVGLVLHSATEPTGVFDSSHAKLNQLQHNILWGQKGNYMEVPTDCPQRDERLGWMGDAQAFIRTAAFNMNVAPFFTKWMWDVCDAQSDAGAFTDVSPRIGCGEGVAAWADAGVICPWTTYLCYDDTRILDVHYASMARFISYMLETWPDFLRHGSSHVDSYGDWLAINSFTPVDLIGTAYFAYSVALMHQTAAVLNKTADAERYLTLFNRIKQAFNAEFVSPRGRLAGDSQTAYVLALAFDLLDEPQRAGAIAQLCKDIQTRGVPTTGFVGANLLLPTLSKIGRHDLAYKLLLNERYPSWLYSVNHGATTIWERWDGWTQEKGFQDPGMNSFNHYAYGSCGQWMYAHIAGLEFTEPAFKHALVYPKILQDSPLTHAAGKLETPYGPLSTSWSIADRTFTMEVTVPPNTSATIVLPTLSAQGVTESGQPLPTAALSVHDGHPAYHAAAGSYAFRVPL